MTATNRYYERPMNLHRPRQGAQSTKTKIAIAQTNSARARNAKITLSTPDWEKTTKEKDRK